jgi:hypothetical protein
LACEDSDELFLNLDGDSDEDAKIESHGSEGGHDTGTEEKRNARVMLSAPCTRRFYLTLHLVFVAARVTCCEEEKEKEKEKKERG